MVKSRREVNVIDQFGREDNCQSRKPEKEHSSQNADRDAIMFTFNLHCISFTIARLSRADAID